ncbi:protein of unknown function DUF86 [Gloeothece citriformis PCC 7424]|uniref:Nucleotidyltransferase n=1 Tax=Gloeothece citriformis (strain PCC 7424) TaxID=65393 RepID=B7KFG0_GLOC7|nr:DUF86 domain-containing protein [Gloeothece citriformis]ACK71876.1 protein of unknown function DUF86 [Gloeothece citriformis PCC 7424]
MNRDRASIIDLVNAAQKIKRFSVGLDRLTLLEDEQKQSAILYQIIVIGEAVKRLSVEFRNQYPSIPWRDIAGMRDIVTHQYDRINIETLWDVIDKDLPELMVLIEPLLSELQ